MRDNSEKRTRHGSFKDSSVFLKLALGMASDAFMAFLSRLGNYLFDLRRAWILCWTIFRTALPLLFLFVIRGRTDLTVVGARLRHSLQRMGITYIKLGQFLAMRFDILPAEICRELAGMFDKVPALSAEQVKATLESELGQSVDDLFSFFEWECIAAASVAQVHRAFVDETQVVAVKIQRPGIAKIFAADIRNFRRAGRVGDYLRLFGPQSIVDAINEFERYTEREMDFMMEGRTAEKLRRNAGPGESAPRVFWKLTTKRILTTELVEGYPLSEIISYLEVGRHSELEQIAPGLDLELAVRNFAWACLRQLFVTGFFHADPHPGNIFLTKDGGVVFVDFGIFGELTTTRREMFASYIENLAVGNVEQSYNHFVKLLQPTTQTDMVQLRRDVHSIMRRWHQASQQPDATNAELHLGTYFGEFIAAIRRNNVQMSMDTLLFWRAILTLDATALRFGNRFDLLSALREFFREVRPSPLERFISLTTDRSVALSLLNTTWKAPGQIQVLSAQLARREYRLPILLSVNDARQSTNANIRLLALVLIGTTAVLLVKSFAGVLGLTLVWLITLTLATAILTRLIRR